MTPYDLQKGRIVYRFLPTHPGAPGGQQSAPPSPPSA
jgi:hypothetical protein